MNIMIAQVRLSQTFCLLAAKFVQIFTMPPCNLAPPSSFVATLLSNRTHTFKNEHYLWSSGSEIILEYRSAQAPLFLAMAEGCVVAFGLC